MIYAFFYQKSFSTPIFLLFAEINLTTRGPLYTCLVSLELPAYPSQKNINFAFSSSLSVFSPAMFTVYTCKPCGSSVQSSKSNIRTSKSVQLSTKKLAGDILGWKLSATFWRLNTTYLVDLNLQLQCFHLIFPAQLKLKVEGWSQLSLKV